MSTNSTPTRIVEITCNIDDMTGEALGSMIDLLLEAGALDAWFVPIYMKQNRPGVTLSALCAVEDTEPLCDLLLEHTTTLGVRWKVLERKVAQREEMSVNTAWGSVRCKIKRLPARVPRLPRPGPRKRPPLANCPRCSPSCRLHSPVTIRGVA